MYIFRMGLRQKFVLLLLATVAVLVFTQWAVARANEEIARASRQRYVSYLLADELRQSSDDLTRLVRTYVVTGDPRWEQQYNEVVLVTRLRDAIDKLNPKISQDAKEDALKKVLRTESPNALINNENFHRYLTDGGRGNANRKRHSW